METEKVIWKLFEKTGNLCYYRLFKAVEKQSKDDFNE